MPSRRTALASSTRLTTWLLLCSGGLLLASACASEQDKVREQVQELAAQVPIREGEALPIRALRMQKEFRPTLAQEVDVDGALVPPKRYDRDLIIRGLTSLRGYRIADLELEALDVRLRDDEQRANVRGVAAMSESQPGDLHAQRMKFELQLEKRGGGWLITRVWFGGSRTNIPEARP